MNANLMTAFGDVAVLEYGERETPAPKAGQVLIPPRVKIAVTIKDEQGKEKVYSTQAKIFLGAPLDF